MALALIGVAAGLGLLATAIVLALLRGWNRSLRQAIANFNLGRADYGPRQTEMPIGRDIEAMLSELRLERKYADSIHVEWSPNTLHQLLDQELPGAQVIVVSNREPYIHNRVDGRVVLQTPASGLVSALEPVMRACGGVWVAHGSGSADRDTVDGRDRVAVPPDKSGLCVAAGLAQRRGAGRLLLRARQRGLMAALPHRLRAADVPRTGLGALCRGQPALRRRRRGGGGPRRSDRPGAGLSLRLAAAHDSQAAAPRDDHRVLAHSVAESGDLRHLPVAGGDHRRTARQLDPRLPHAVPLQQLHRGGRPVHGEPHRPRAKLGDACAGTRRWFGPIRSRSNGRRRRWRGRRRSRSAAGRSGAVSG